MSIQSFKSLSEIEGYLTDNNSFKVAVPSFGGRKIYKLIEGKQYSFSLNEIVKQFAKFATHDARPSQVNKIIEQIKLLDETMEAAFQEALKGHPFKRALTAIKRFFTRRLYHRDRILNRLHQEGAKSSSSLCTIANTTPFPTPLPTPVKIPKVILGSTSASEVMPVPLKTSSIIDPRLATLRPTAPLPAAPHSDAPPPLPSTTEIPRPALVPRTRSRPQRYSSSPSILRTFRPDNIPTRKRKMLESYKRGEQLSKPQQMMLFSEIVEVIPKPSQDPTNSIQGFLIAVCDETQPANLNLEDPNCLRAIKDILTFCNESARNVCAEWLIEQPSFTPKVLACALEAYIERSSRGAQFPVDSLLLFLKEYKQFYEANIHCTDEKNTIDIALSIAIFLDHALCENIIEWMKDQELITFSTFKFWIRAFIRKVNANDNLIRVPFKIQDWLFEIFQTKWADKDLPKDIKDYLIRKRVIAD